MRALQTYSLIKALYDRGKDYIDSFWPILLQVMPSDKRPLAPTAAADEIKQRFGLSIPVHTVQTLAERAKRAHSYLSRESSQYALTDKGIAYLEALETPRQVERRLSALIDHAIANLGVLDARFQSSQFTWEAISAVIENNTLVFEFVIERQQSSGAATSPTVEQLVLDYFSNLERTEPLHFETLRDLILGSTLVGILKRDDINDATRHFRPTELFLDTNVLLSLLNLRFEVQCRPAAELLHLLTRSARFSLYVFDFSIAELTALLRGYDSGGKTFIPHVKVQALYSSLQFRGITPSDIAILLADLPVRLKALGISIVNTGATIESCPAELVGAMSDLSHFKPDQDDRGKLHDLLAIANVALRRGREVPRKVEDARVFFLTEDYRLSNYAYMKRGHQANHTVSEVMPDRLLTNLLWLKHPDTFQALPIAAVIAMHSRGLFIERQVWERFYAELARLTASGDIAEENASLLIYDAQVHKDLVGLGPDSHKLDRAWLLERLEEARVRQEAAQQHDLSLQEEHLTAQHGEEIDRLESTSETAIRAANERAELFESTLQAVRAAEAERKQRLTADEKRIALLFARWCTVGVKTVALVWIGWALTQIGLLILARWRELEGPMSLLSVGVPFAFALAGWRFDPLSAWRRLEAYLGDRFLSKRLARLDSLIGDGAGDSSVP